MGYDINFELDGPLRTPPLSDVGNIQEDLAPGEVRLVPYALLLDVRTRLSVEVSGRRLASAEAICGDFAEALAAFDCDQLRIAVTLDNRLSGKPTSFSLDTTDFAGALSSEVVTVPAGQIVRTAVSVANNAFTDLQVRVGSGSLAGTQGACGTFIYDPRAAFGELDCGDLGVVLTLDNSRSTGRARFGIENDVAFEEVVLSAGEARVLSITLPQGPKEFAVYAAAAGGLDRISTAKCQAAPTPYDVDVTVSPRSVPLGGTLNVSAKCNPQTVRAQVVLGSGQGIDDVLYAEVTLTPLPNGQVTAKLPVYANSDLPAPVPGPAVIAVYCNEDASQGPLGFGSAGIVITAAVTALDPVNAPVADRDPSAQLANTGSELSSLLALAGTLLIAGAIIALLRRRLAPV